MSILETYTASSVINRLRKRRDMLAEYGIHSLHFDDAMAEMVEAHKEGIRQGKDALADEIAREMTENSATKPANGDCEALSADSSAINDHPAVMGRVERASDSRAIPRVVVDGYDSDWNDG